MLLLNFLILARASAIQEDFSLLPFPHSIPVFTPYTYCKTLVKSELKVTRIPPT